MRRARHKPSTAGRQSKLGTESMSAFAWKRARVRARRGSCFPCRECPRAVLGTQWSLSPPPRWHTDHSTDRAASNVPRDPESGAARDVRVSTGAPGGRPDQHPARLGERAGVSPRCRSGLADRGKGARARRDLRRAPSLSSHTRTNSAANGVALQAAEVDHHARVVTDGPGIVPWRDVAHVAGADLALETVVHHDLHSS